MIEHPVQPVLSEPDGSTHFKGNEIVKFLYQRSRRMGVGLHELVDMPFPKEDMAQFLQLLSYSVPSFRDLAEGSFASPEFDRVLKVVED